MALLPSYAHACLTTGDFFWHHHCNYLLFFLLLLLCDHPAVSESSQVREYNSSSSTFSFLLLSDKEASVCKERHGVEEWNGTRAQDNSAVGALQIAVYLYTFWRGCLCLPICYLKRVRWLFSLSPEVLEGKEDLLLHRASSHNDENIRVLLH